MERRIAVNLPYLAAAVALTLAGCGGSSPTAAPADPGQVTVAVDATLAPRGTPPLDANGTPRPLGRLVGPKGDVDFVLDELVVQAPDRAAAEALAARWHGAVLDEVVLAGVGGLYRLKVETAGVDTGLLPGRLKQLVPSARGQQRVSSAAAGRLLALAAEEVAVRGTSVGLNFLFEGAAIADGHTTDGSGVDAFATQAFTQSRVGQAWQVLRDAGRLTPQVTSLVIDGGFVQNPDLPPSTVIFPANAWNQPNPWGCGGQPCPWHGTDVASALAGAVDNQYGGFGPAGPVTSKLVLARTPAADLWQMLAFLIYTIPNALGEHPRIVNFSGGMTVPGAFGFLCKPLEWAISGLRHGGVLFFAAAGNDGENVDDEDCFIACWESAVYAPCELDDVVCVGGVDSVFGKAPESNWGQNQRAAHAYPGPTSSDNSVDLYGPFMVMVGPDHDSSGTATGTAARPVLGTSVASPFVAGVAALVWAADPGLTADQVVAALVGTAIRFGGPSSLRNDLPGYLVDAYAAVKSVLGDMPPTISITAPTDPFTYQVSPVGLTFTASASDWEDGVPAVTWTSSADGPLGSGTTVTVDFATLGTRAVTATARDSAGHERSASVTVTVTQTAPQVGITEPAPSAQVVAGLPFQLVANLGFAGNAFRTLTCQWTTGDPLDVDFPASGCTTTGRLRVLGPRTITLTVTDEYQLSSTAQVGVEVVAPGPGPAPYIASPASNGSALVGDLVLLDGGWTSGQEPATSAWLWQRLDLACPELTLATRYPGYSPPGAGRAFTGWDTSGAVAIPNGCGYGDGELRLRVIDAYGQTATAAIPFHLRYIPPPN